MTFIKQISLFQNKPASTATTTTSSGPASLTSMLSGTSSNGVPQSLEQLLERQWEQGSQFLMEQAQHFDSKIQTFSPAKKKHYFKNLFSF